MAATNGGTPLDFFEDNSVFSNQGGVREEPLGEGGLDASDGFPVGGADVGAKCEANLEEQVVCKDVREGPGNIGMMFYLVEAQFDVIGMDDIIVFGVQDLQDVHSDEDLLADIAESAVEF